MGADSPCRARYGQYLVCSLLAVLAGLPVGSLAGGFIFAFYNFATQSGKLEDLAGAMGLGLFVALVATFLGILPSFLYGAPLYALLARRGLASSLSALIVGALPGGVLIIVSDAQLGGLVLVFGACVAVATYVFARRRMSSLGGAGAEPSRLEGVTIH